MEAVRASSGATCAEVDAMKGVLEAWQVQAQQAQTELVLVSGKLKDAANQRTEERKKRERSHLQERQGAG